MNQLIYKFKALALATTFAVGLNTQVSAQTHVIIGAGSNTATTSNGAATDAGPMYCTGSTSSFVYSKHFMVYTEAELQAAGLPPNSVITQISWYKANNAAYSSSSAAIFDIYLKNSSATSVPAVPYSFSTAISGATQVYGSTTQTFSSNIGWVEFNLTTPFTYTGGALELTTNWDISAGGSSASGATANFAWAKDPGYNILSHAAATQSADFTFARTARAQIRITYVPGGPCTSPPNAGTSTTSSAIACAGQNITLGLSGASMGTGQTYQWQSGPSATGPWTNIGGSLTAPSFNTTATAGTTYYQCVVTCGASSATSTPVMVTGSAGLSSNTYTINKNQPTGGLNFNSFADAISALECGVSGPVTFEVVPNSGPYTERIALGNILGTSATNYVRFNGNGNTVQFATSAGANNALLEFNGTKHVRIDSLNFVTTSTASAWGALITGGSQYDSITNCTFDLSSVTATASANNSGILFSGSNTTATTTGLNGSYCYIAGNHIKGANGTGGMYYGISIVSGGNDYNIIKNNIVENYYYYAFYLSGATGTVVEGNEFHRTNKTASMSNYNFYTTGVTPGTIITGNRLHHPGGATNSSGTAYCYYLLGDGTAADPVIFSNNVLSDVNRNGLIYGIYLSTAPYTKVYHNTAVFDQALASTSATYGIYATGTNTNTDIINNIVSITAGTAGTKYGFYYSSAASVANAQKNNFYVNSTQSGTQYYGYYGSAHATQTAFQAAYPTLEVGSPTVDPQFVSAATGNFTPTNLALLNTGMNLITEVPQDILGNPRSISPTPGAFEMSAPSGANGSIAALINPSGLFCPGNQNVRVALANLGTTTLTGFQIQWQVNGVTQTAYTYTGSLAPLGASTGQSEDTVTIGTANIPAAGTNIKAWVVISGDINNSNDTILENVVPTQFTIAGPANDTVCFGSNVTMSLDPSSGYNQGMITWQSSTNGTTFNPIANSDQPAYTANNVSNTVWYRVSINDGNTTCITPNKALATVNPTVTATTPASRCGEGTLQLGATAGAGAEIHWYDAATGGNLLGTGNTFTTPNIQNTTTYYAAARVSGGGSGTPELMYYKFDEPGTSVYNYASQPVGLNPAPVTGLTIGGTGQFGTGLQGNAGATATNKVDPGWTGTHNGSWTISFWMNVPPPPTTRYLFGNSSGNGTFRCFIGGAANGIRLTGGTPSITLDMPAWTSGTSVITYVYDQSTGMVSGYINGVFQASVSAGNSYPLVGTNFVVGSQGTSIEGIMDEFRMYSRALTAAEIAATWNTELGACTSTRVPVVATINPDPVVDLGPDTLVCTPSYTLNAGNPGANYLWNNNSSNQTLTATTSGQYSVTVTDANNCSASDTVQVDLVAPPVVNLGNDTSICQGASITLDAGNPGATYVWDNTQPTQTRTVNTSGQYYVEVSYNANCKASDTINITVNPLPVVDLGPDTALCGTGSILLDAGNPGASYEWDDNSNGQTRTILSVGTYYVTVTDANNCSAADTINVDQIPNPSGDFNVQEGPNGNMNFTATAANALSYHWDFGDGAQGSGNPRAHQYAANGNYNVTLTMTNECGAETQVVREVSVRNVPVGIDELIDDKNIMLFPNPANNKVTISNEGTHVIESIAITDALGRQLQLVINETKASELNLDLNELSSGWYNVIIQTESGKVVRKLNVLK